MKEKRQQPNVLLICSDQHSVGVSGSYGNDIVATPHLDSLSREGTQFDAAYCNCPLCVPSRMSFLTGKHPFNCDVLNNGCVLDSRVPTFAHMLTGAGYHTVLSGRMHFSGPDQLHGFTERLLGDIMPYAFHNMGRGFPNSPLPGNLAHMEKPDPLLSVGAGSTSLLDYDNAVTGAACQWLDSYGNLDTAPPFIMTIGLFNPHCPYIAPPELYQKYASRVSIEPLSLDEFALLHPFHKSYLERIDIVNIPQRNLDMAAAAYYGLVEFIDQRIGEIVNALERADLAENTIIIYMSDHGEMLGEHGRWHKGCFYEAASRVPMIIKIPDIEGGKNISSPVSLVDLSPTLAELCGAEISSPSDGRSLTPMLYGDSSSDELPVFVEYYDNDANRMVRSEKWKLNYYGKYDSYELFDLDTDPNENRDIYDSMKDSKTVKDLKSMLFSDGWHKNINRDFDKRMNRIGYWKNNRDFAQGAGDDTLIKEIPGYWRQIETCKNILYENNN